MREGGACECCGGARREFVSRKRGWDIHRCLDCGLCFVLPLPSREALEALYDGGGEGGSGYQAILGGDLSRTSAAHARLLDGLLLDIVPGRGAFLDVGCSDGRLIHHLRALGWEVRGIDLNPGALRIAERHGLDVRRCAIEEMAAEEGSFDVVHMGDVLEHELSPSKAVAAARGLLREGGVLAVNTPNADSGFGRSTRLLSRWTGFPWPHSEAPYHLYEFTPRALRTLLAREGFDVISTAYRRGNSLGYTVGATGCFDGLKRRMKAKGRYGFDWGLVPAAPRIAAAAALLAPFHLLGALFDKSRGRGAKMLFLARKGSKARGSEDAA